MAANSFSLEDVARDREDIQTALIRDGILPLQPNAGGTHCAAQMSSIGARIPRSGVSENMKRKINLPEWILPELLKDALVIGFVLSVCNYALDVLLFWMGIPKAATVFDDLTVGVLGAVLSLFYMSSVRTNQIYLRAKERMILTAELNRHVRGALTSIRQAASLEDAGKRMHRVDEAIEQIDRVLLELVPTVGSADAPRALSPEQE